MPRPGPPLGRPFRTDRFRGHLHDDLQDDATEGDIADAPNADDSTAFFDDPESFTNEPVTVRGRIVRC